MNKQLEMTGPGFDGPDTIHSRKRTICLQMSEAQIDALDELCTVEQRSRSNMLQLLVNIGVVTYLSNRKQA